MHGLELFPRARSAGSLTADTEPSATMSERVAPGRKMKRSASKGGSASRIHAAPSTVEQIEVSESHRREKTKEFNATERSSAAAAATDASKLRRLLLSKMSRESDEAQVESSLQRSSSLTATSVGPGVSRRPSVQPRTEAENFDNSLPVYFEKTLKGSSHRRAAASCTGKLQQVEKDDDLPQDEVSRRLQNRKTPKSSSKVRRFKSSNALCIDTSDPALAEDASVGSCTPMSAIRLTPLPGLGLLEDFGELRRNPTPQAASRCSRPSSRPSTSGRCNEGLLEPLTPTGICSGGADDEPDQLFSRRHSRFDALSRSSSSSTIANLLGDDVIKGAMTHSRPLRQSLKSSADGSSGGDQHGLYGAQAWPDLGSEGYPKCQSWSQCSTTASSLAADVIPHGSSGNSPPVPCREVNLGPLPRQSVWEDQRSEASQSLNVHEAFHLDDLGGSASALLRRRRLVPLSVDTQSLPASGSEQKEIRLLGKHEKIFDLYHWDEVLQEEGDGGKVVVCKPKGALGPNASPKRVMKIRSKESLERNGLQEQFRLLQLRMLNLPPHPGVLPI